MKKLAVLLFLHLSLSAGAQWYVGVKLMGISIHTDKGLNSSLFHCAVGKNNRVAFHIGVAVMCEYRFNNWLSAKYDQCVFRDCAAKFAGMSMFNLRYTQDLGRAGDVSAGMGPFFYYRKSWYSIPEYEDDGYFHVSRSGKWQTKFVWYGGEIEYNYPLNDHTDWSTNILPGIPVVVAVASGVRVAAR